MSPADSGVQQSVRRAVSALARGGVDGPRPVDELAPLLEGTPGLAEALADELRGADERRLPAAVRLVELLRVPEALDSVAEVVFDAPAGLEAKERALSAHWACERPAPEGVEVRLREARKLVESGGAADPEAVDRVLSWPDPWRVPTLRGWLDALADEAENQEGETADGNAVESPAEGERPGRTTAPVGADGGAMALVRRTLGHDRAVDLLLLEWLGDRKDAVAAEIAAAHAGRAADRDVAKAAKRALHRLRSRGIEIDEARESGGGFSLAVESEALGESRAWWTSHDGSGTRIVWVLWPSASGGSRLLQAVVGDDGLEEVETRRVTRNEVRRYLERLEEDPSLLMERIEPSRAAAVMARAAGRSEERGQEPPAAYREWLETGGTMAQAGGTAEAVDRADGAGAAAIYEHVPEDEVRDDSGLIEEAVELLREPFLTSWAIGGEVVERAAERIRQAEESNLLVNDEQRRERMQDAIRSAVDEAFDDDTRRRYRRRLEDLAGMLWRQERRDAARRLLAAALGLTDMNDLFARHAFARALVHRGVWISYNERRRQEGASESRIVRP